MDWQFRFHQEIEHAEAARQLGNEGRARVCARRAAGVVIGEYFRRQGIDFQSPSAHDRLKFLAALPETSSEVLELVQYMLMRVTEEYTLPVEVDLIMKSRQLAKILLGLSSGKE